MGRLILKCFCLFAVLGNLNAVFGLPIEIISQEYHVWGDIVQESYDITSSTPVSGGCQEYIAIDNGWITESSSTLGSTADFIVLYSTSRSEYPWTITQADAEAIYIFTPTTDILQIDFTGMGTGHAFENYGYFTLENLNTSVVLDSQRWAYEPTPEGGFWEKGNALPDSVIYDVLLENQYRLTVGVNGALNDWRHGSMHLEATIIPEPATLLLLGLGAVIALGLRRKNIRA